jgi:hemolysin activation/secretion protein
MSDNEMIKGIIGKIINDENAAAQQDIFAVLAAKTDDAINTRKIELAQSLYNSDPSEEEISDEPE